MRAIAYITAAAIVLLTSSQAIAGEIIVSAAASLTDAFRRIEGHYDRPRPDGGAAMNFASSGALLRQMEMGAPVDVFVSADDRTMRLAIQKGLVYEDSVTVFAANTLVVIVPVESNLRLSSPTGLTDGNVGRIAVGNPASVPAGRYVKDALAKSGVWSLIENKLIFAEDVRQALDYVRRGEVDAGVVYATDAARAGDSVTVVATIETLEPIEYPVAVAVTATNRKAAEEFIEFLGKGTATKILEEHGFVPVGALK